MTDHPSVPNRRPLWQQRLRRMAMLAHLIGFLLTLLVWFPLISHAHRQRIKTRWSKRLLRLAGLRLIVQGEIAPGSLIVANHISWFDIFAISAVGPAAFIAKSEIARWPVIGWFCRKTDALFIDRSSAQHAQHVAHDMARLLASGRSVAFFPEGTTSLGDQVRPFHAALFQPAIAAGAMIQPIAVRYRNRAGERTRTPSYAGTSFGNCLSATLAETGLSVEIICLPPFTASNERRRPLSTRAEAAIRAATSD